MRRSRKVEPELVTAAATGNAALVVELIAKKVNLEAHDHDGRTALHRAVLGQDLRIAQLLVEAGANVNALDKQKWSALHFAAQDQSIDLVRLLVEAGGNVNAGDEHGNTPLSRAIFSSGGKGEVISILVEHGSDAHLCNNHGVSPYKLAETIANFDVLSVLNAALDRRT